MNRTLWTLVLAAALFPARPGFSQDFPEGKGKDVFVTGCSQCHGIDVVQGMKLNLEEWKAMVGQMVANGAPLQDEEAQMVAEYLAKNFGPTKPAASETKPDAGESKPVSSAASKPKINVNKSTAKELETGLEISAMNAEALVAYRKEHGNFHDWNDLSKVINVDAKKLEAAKDRLEF